MPDMCNHIIGRVSAKSVSANDISANDLAKLHMNSMGNSTPDNLHAL